VIHRSKFSAAVLASGIDRLEGLTVIEALAEIYEPEPLPMQVSRNRDDDMVLALAVAARVDAIVTGDRDLLSLGSWDRIPIKSPSAFVSESDERS
jgi:putative PIN family toxin of toxin-antitoxin system